MVKNVELKKFRVGLDLTQAEIAAKMGVTRERYQKAESGAREVRQDFWRQLQAAFNLSDAQIWALMNGGAQND